MISISLLLPTRERSSFVHRLFDSLIETTFSLQEIEFVLYMDDDDPESHGISNSALNITRIIRQPGNTMGNITRECYKASKGHYVMLMNDDVVFRTADWDVAVKKAFARFDDDIALVYGNDLDQGKAVPTFPILSKKVCGLMGNICPKEYLNLHIESHIFDIFNRLKRLGQDRIVYLEDVVFEHLHHSLGKSEYDNVSIKKDTGADDRLFVALAEERMYAAKKLEGFIKGLGNAESFNKADREEIVLQESQSPEVSIILPYVTDCSEQVGFSLKAIFDDGKTPHGDFEVIISTESAETGNLEQDKRVRIVKTGENSHVPHLFNKGAAESRGKILIFIKPGCMPEPGWINELMKVIHSENDIGVVGCKIVNRRNRRIIHAGIGFYKNRDLLKTTFMYRGFRAENPVVNRQREFQAVNGGCIMMKKELFRDIGGFNESPDLMEDIDICLRARSKGLRNMYTPEAVLYSHGNGSLEKSGSSTCTISPLDEKWAEQVQCDLEILLEEDGFSLCKHGANYSISPK